MITSKRKFNHETSNLAIFINVILFLVDFPDDTCEWFLKTVEVIAFLTLLMASWKWRICPMLQYFFNSLKHLQIFQPLKQIFMNVLKIISGIACGFLIVLMNLFIFLENPEKKLYEETVELIMTQEGLSSFQVVVDSFPEIKNIKSKIERIDYLKSSIHSIAGGPAPNVSKEESLHIQDCIQEIQTLQNSVKENLTEILASYSINYP